VKPIDKKYQKNINLVFHEKKLNYVVIRWDSKILPSLTGKNNIDRLAIIAITTNVEQLL
jgi:hypothetical protein